MQHTQTTEAHGRLTIPRLLTRGRRRRPIESSAKRRRPVPAETEPTSYVGRRRAEGDAQ